MVVNIVDVGWATIKSGCLPITDIYWVLNWHTLSATIRLVRETIRKMARTR